MISGPRRTVTAEHIAAIKTLVDLKKGLFLWADNDPYTADVNAILAALPQTSQLSISGNFRGDTLLKEATELPPQEDRAKGQPLRRWSPGFQPGHLIATGLETLYEGITISSVKGPCSQFRALNRSSDGNVVTGIHDRDHCRIIIDGGYTRLLESLWDRTAGTARFVTNAACWLYNHESRVARQKAKAKAKAASAGAAAGGGGGAAGGSSRAAAGRCFLGGAAAAFAAAEGGRAPLRIVEVDAAGRPVRQCPYGVKCVKFGCTAEHPYGRKKDCHWGAKCNKGAACPFLHPKKT